MEAQADLNITWVKTHMGFGSRIHQLKWSLRSKTGGGWRDWLGKVGGASSVVTRASLRVTGKPSVDTTRALPAHTGSVLVDC